MSSNVMQLATFRPHRKACGSCLECETRSMALCAALDDDEVGALEAVMTGMQLQPNAILVMEGQPRTRVYSLTAGMLRLSTALPDGRRQISGFLVPGDYLGLADEDHYAATAEAIGTVSLCSFSAGEMDRLVERFPRLKDRLHLFTRKALRQARENQMLLGRLTPQEKLASFLLTLSVRAVEHRQPANPIDLPMSRTDIADYLGLTIETVSRSFTKLRSRGLIRLTSTHCVEIVDQKALARLAGIASPEQ